MAIAGRSARGSGGGAAAAGRSSAMARIAAPNNAVPDTHIAACSPVHVITISDPPMRGRLALTWRADAPVSPAARALITHARAEFGEPR